MAGLFIALEGIDGSGKSTQAKLLSEKLSVKGYSIYETSEPTDGLVGAIIKKILREHTEISAEALALLFVADRIEHAKSIREALAQGKVVISDRYMLSTLAYQSAQGVDLGFLRALHGNLPKPDLTLILDIGPEKSLSRISADEKFEKLEFLSKVRQRYLELAGAEKNTVIVSAELGLHKVSETILSAALHELRYNKYANLA